MQESEGDNIENGEERILGNILCNFAGDCVRLYSLPIVNNSEYTTLAIDRKFAFCVRLLIMRLCDRFPSSNSHSCIRTMVWAIHSF